MVPLVLLPDSTDLLDRQKQQLDTVIASCTSTQAMDRRGTRAWGSTSGGGWGSAGSFKASRSHHRLHGLLVNRVVAAAAAAESESPDRSSRVVDRRRAPHQSSPG
jgi:hypothetical protein